MSSRTAAAIMDYFLPQAARRCLIDFHGGEPLLAFDVVRGAVEHTRELARKLGRRPVFGVTTNGSLIDGEVLAFLERHRFAVTLSYDGQAQERQRAEGTAAGTVSVLKRLLARRRIRVEVNSVYTPDSVGLLGRSTGELLALGVPGLRVSFDLFRPWSRAARRRLADELAKLRILLLREHARSGRIPVVDYRPAPRSGGALICAGGARAAAVDPDGGVWGCHLFTEIGRRRDRRGFRRRFRFGRLEDLPARWDEASAGLIPRYAALSMTNSTVDGAPCALCPDVTDCDVCPLTPVLAGFSPTRIPAYICAVQRIRIRERRLFLRSLP